MDAEFLLDFRRKLDEARLRLTESRIPSHPAKGAHSATAATLG